MPHLVIDGSNIATEGRTLPSLAQLDEAVRGFLEWRPHDTMTVVVDATFEHRIDQSERPMYDEALANNELITPPAGTIGRGDKFLLEIAQRANATVFSNDSFQEFHGEYDWLFDDGRLIGGKPVPGVGWIFIERTPVRGVKSRLAVREAKRGRGRAPAERATATATAGEAGTAASRRRRRAPSTGGYDPTLPPLPVPTAPPPGLASLGATTDDAAPAAPATPRRRVRTTGNEPVNEPLPFIEFIAEHPVGSIVVGTVVDFTSHGAYVEAEGVRCYLALKHMADPPPRSGRELLQRGEEREFVVQALDAPRRGIDLAVPGFEQPDTGEGPEAAPESVDEVPQVADRPRRRTRAVQPVEAAAFVAPPMEVAPAADPAPAKRRATRKKKAAEPLVEVAVAPEPEPAVEPESAVAEPVKKRAARKKKAAEPPVELDIAPEPVTEPEPVVAPEPVKKRAARKRTAPALELAPESVPVEPEPAPVEPEPVKKRATRKKKAAEPVADSGVAAPAAEPVAKRPRKR